MKAIVVLCEADDQDLALIVHARDLAKAFDGKLYLIHVASPDPDFVGYSAGPQHERDFRASTLHDEHRVLQKRAEELRQQNIDAKALLLQGETVPTVLKEADRLNADLIIIGNHQHGVFYKWLAGSTADGVLYQISRPLLFVPVAS
jgi:nucleotide-binding universal stress UspA family protein